MSADQLDDAVLLEQLDRDNGLRRVASAIAAQEARRTVYHSHCAWCQEPSPDGREYCSYGFESCALDARREQEIRGKQRRS